MGWLFGREKKMPKVPFPQGYPVEEGALRFPNKLAKERVIEPERLKEVAGVSDPLSFPEEEAEIPQAPVRSAMAATKTEVRAEPMPLSQDEPLFVQVEVYREILGATDGLKRDLTHLQETTKNLEMSEYNEENNFTRLRRSVKSVHDRLLDVDKILFKS